MEKVKEILEDHGLDFRINKFPLVALDGTNIIESPYFGLVNDKTGEVLNTVKNSYTVSQNEEIVKMVLKGMEPFGSKLEVTNAGALHGGRKVFLQLAIEGHAKVGNDVLKRYVTVIDSNDGSTGLSVGIGDLTMSCQNQFYHFYKSGMKFRHTTTIAEKIAVIPELIGEALSKSLEMVNVYSALAATKTTKKLVDDLVQHIAGIDKRASVNELADASTRKVNAMDALYKNIGIEMAQKGDNLWGLHSGVTRWTTHEKSAPRRDNGRIESMMGGNNYKTNQKSLEFVMELL